ncbi:MAG: SDR family oxidoreductase [Pseudomonadota bacterium]
MKFDGTTTAIVGGGSGIGRAIALAAANAGSSIVLSSRNEDRLMSVAKAIGNARVIPLDMTKNSSRATWADALPEVDHLVISASSAAHGPFDKLEEQALRAMFDAKFFGPYMTAKAALPKLKSGGSITLFSGVLSRRPGLNCSGLGAVNGAVESLTYGLALELGPKFRVNCLSPGMVRSEAYKTMEPVARESMYESTGNSLPLGRVGNVEEIAEATLFLMSNTYGTGIVLDVDGGHRIRQYATRS